MKSILSTDPDNLAALAARITLALVVFPHGAQKLFGWFGGYGFTTTLHYLTGGPDLPWIIALFVILIESIAPLFLLVGYGTRIASILIFFNFIGVMFHSHVKNGFFMNWQRVPDTGEGYEFFLLLLGLTIVLMFTGGGGFSVDAAITNKKERVESD